MSYKHTLKPLTPHSQLGLVIDKPKTTRLPNAEKLTILLSFLPYGNLNYIYIMQLYKYFLSLSTNIKPCKTINKALAAKTKLLMLL